MRRDSIFYKLFQQSPSLVFELLPQPPANAQAYRFDSVAVKEPRFEIDGVFLPPEGEVGVIYFCEIQFQKDERLYERVFAECLLYFYRNRERFSNWQIVVIYPSRSLEQGQLYPYQVMLNSEQVHRVYLDELGEIRSLPLWMAVMVLTTVAEDIAAEEARYLLSRTRQKGNEAASRAIIELVTTIMAYRFVQMSRAEVEAMLDITLKETRVYREIKEEGRQEGRQEEAATLLLRQLTKRFGNLPETAQTAIAALSLSALEDLSEALLDFTSLADLKRWLVEQK
jgi:predicted transposase/invertase (TIGR01784 family)